MAKNRKGAAAAIGILVLIAGIMGGLSDTVTTSVVAGATGNMMAAEIASSSSGSSSCSSPSDGDSSDGGSADSANSNALHLAQSFADAGFSKAATAGMLGNIQAESGFRPEVVNSIGATGLAQWYPGSKISSWLSANGHGDLDPLSLEAQTLLLTDSVAKGEGWSDVFLSAFESEGYTAVNGNAGMRLYNTWRDSSDPKASAVAWMDGFERPGHTTSEAQKRGGYAQSWYDTGLNGITFTGKPSADGGDAIEACDPGGEVADNEKVEAYVQWALKTAEDESVGYSQANRQLNPDVDCSSFVYYSLKLGAKFEMSMSYPFTTFNMGVELASHGFVRHDYTGPTDLKRGDILVDPSAHTEIYTGEGKSVGAHSDRGYPQAGDQTGTEVNENYMWTGAKEYWRYEQAG